MGATSETAGTPAPAGPSVTVLMPIYNGEQFLDEAVESILAQTLTNFELLIINDGSTDGSEALIRSYTDPRIKYVRNETNMGLIATLNRGVDLARGKYIARMDSDDIARPQRLERQIALLETDPSIDVCSAWIQTFGDGPSVVFRFPSDRNKVRAHLLFENVIPHPAVVFRRSLVTDPFYDSAFPHAEDFELWVRLSRVHGIVCIPEVLLDYRFSKNSVTSKFAAEQKSTVRKIVTRSLRELGLAPSEEEISVHLAIASMNFPRTVDYLRKTERWMQKIIEANAAAGLYPEPELRTLLSDRWMMTLNIASELGPEVLRLYWSSSLSSPWHRNIGMNVKFLIKCLIRRPTLTASERRLREEPGR